jgi:hypothetical protein
MESQHLVQRNHVLQHKAPPVAQIHGSVLTTAYVTTPMAIYTAGTAALTKTGNLQAVPLTCALMVWIP